MKYTFFAIVLLSFFSCTPSQENTNPHSTPEENTPRKFVGGPCEGCTAIYEYGNRQLSSIDTLPEFQQTNPKLKISGTVYQMDGKTPAENVLLYIYQTNRRGTYETKVEQFGRTNRHGDIRGWVKTGKDGKYTFYTFRPASYPERQEPEHIHLTVKEPDKNEYYLDDYVFEDDPLLTKARRQKLRNRGGSGIRQPVLVNDIWTINRDLILGKNIPDY